MSKLFPNTISNWCSATYMMLGVGVLGISFVILGMKSINSEFALLSLIMPFIVGSALLMYGIGLRDGIQRERDSGADEIVDADKEYRLPSNDTNSILQLRHYGIFALFCGVSMWNLLRDSNPQQAMFWSSAFALYGGTIIGFDLGIKRFREGQQTSSDD